MSRLASWLAAREPAPPRPLAERLRTVDGEAGGSGALSGVLTERALSALERAHGATGRVRAAAFDLLEADALLTYACEAALAEEDPEAALTRVLERSGAAPRP